MLLLRSLPIAFRALFSSFLILIRVGYLMALSFMYLVVIEPHQQMGEGVVAVSATNITGCRRARL